MTFLQIEAKGLMSIQGFANTLVDKGLAATNLEGGGIQTIKEFTLIVDQPTGMGIVFPEGVRIDLLAVPHGNQLKA